VNCNLLAALNC